MHLFVISLIPCPVRDCLCLLILVVGKIRSLGVSNFGVNEMAQLKKIATSAPEVIQNKMDVYHQVTGTFLNTLRPNYHHHVLKACCLATARRSKAYDRI